jgi:hypothetical protein
MRYFQDRLPQRFSPWQVAVLEAVSSKSRGQIHGDVVEMQS